MTLTALAIICSAITLGLLTKTVIEENRKMNIGERKFTKKEQVEKIIREVCEAAEITIEQIKSKSRKREFVVPRQVACYLIKERLGEEITLAKLGMFLSMHHATVIHSHKVVRHGIETGDRFIMRVIERLELDKIAA